MREINCGGVRWLDLENPSRTNLTILEIDHDFHSLNLEEGPTRAS